MTFEEWWTKNREEMVNKAVALGMFYFRTAIESAWNAALESRWQPIETAPRDGTIVDVWLGGYEVSEQDLEFYCSPGTRRSTNWYYSEGRFRPYSGIMIPCSIEPTHWMSLPGPPKDKDRPE